MKKTKVEKHFDIVAENYDYYKIKNAYYYKNLKKLLERFERFGVVVEVERRNAKSSTLAGKSFVITGTLGSMSREEAKEKIRVLGGDVSESVSRKTSYVVAGSEPGSKHERAKELGVEILDERGFLKIIGG